RGSEDAQAGGGGLSAALSPPGAVGTRVAGDGTLALGARSGVADAESAATAFGLCRAARTGSGWSLRPPEGEGCTDGGESLINAGRRAEARLLQVAQSRRRFSVLRVRSRTRLSSAASSTRDWP